MQGAAGVGTQANHVTRIGRDFWLKQDHIEHLRSVAEMRAILDHQRR